MNHPLDYWRSGFSGSLRDASWQRAVDRLFDDWTGGRGLRPEGGLPSFNPHCEVSETKTHYLVRFDLPGLTREQIKVDLHDGYLTVSGERREERKEEDKKRHFSEVFYGSFSRAFSFPTGVDAERTEAKYENGVLSIQVPKAEVAKTRQISVR